MICIVSHDAGGAEILSSYVRQTGLACIFCLGGPAINIFRRKLPKVESVSLAEAINAAELILCGTSWQSDLEWQSIQMARVAGKRSVAFLDHWVNYRERFVRNGEEHLPDEIWVGDIEAEAMAGRLFLGMPIRRVDNPYFNDLRAELAQLPGPVKQDAAALSVLYVCEPLREHALREHGDERYWGYTEEDALRYFLDNLDVLDRPVERIIIRPHPSEASEKYDWAVAEYKLPLERGGSKSLFEEVAASDIVVGCESMAMVIGLLANRRVLSCIPPGGKACGLPQAEIESLQALVTTGLAQATSAVARRGL